MHKFNLMMKEINSIFITCPIRQVISRFGDKWSLLVLYTIHVNGTIRFSEIHKQMEDISQKMLSSTLKRLSDSNLIIRKQYPQIPPRVEYSLSETGSSLMPYIMELISWSKEHFNEVTNGKVINPEQHLLISMTREQRHIPSTNHSHSIRMKLFMV